MRHKYATSVLCSPPSNLNICLRPVLPGVPEVGALEAAVRAVDRVAAAPDPDRGSASASRRRKTDRDVRHPLRRPAHHRQEEEGAFQEGE